MRKPKTIEITVRVRVPQHWSVAHARREVSQAWYGEIYARGPDFYEQVSLFPRWGKARRAAPAPTTPTASEKDTAR